MSNCYCALTPPVQPSDEHPAEVAAYLMWQVHNGGENVASHTMPNGRTMTAFPGDTDADVLARFEDPLHNGATTLL